MPHIGVKIKERREALGITQEELAIKLGYKSRSTINKIEAGINDITQSKITAFAKALDTSPAWLMGWEDFSNQRRLAAVSLEAIAAELNIPPEILENLEQNGTVNPQESSELIRKLTKVTQSLAKANGTKEDSMLLNSLLDSYARLNEEGRQEAEKRIRELTEINRYCK